MRQMPDYKSIDFSSTADSDRLYKQAKPHYKHDIAYSGQQSGLKSTEYNLCKFSLFASW